MSPAPKKAPATGQATTGAGDTSATCPWCSASIPAAAATCPSCGAQLRDAVDGEVLGVTQIDPGAISRAARIKPGRIATWLGAERTSEPVDLGGKVEPPSKAVREEMLRLELAAIDAEIEAKAAQAAAERELPPDDGSEPQPEPGSAPESEPQSEPRPDGR
jgi:hypothetical protein